MRSRPKYLADGIWCLVQYKTPMLFAEINMVKLTKAITRKMGYAMIPDWFNISDDGLIESIDFVKEEV